MKHLSPITKAKLKKLVTHLGFQAVSSEDKMPTARTDEIMSQVGLSSPFPDPAPPILSSTPVAHSSGHLLHEPSNRHSDSSIGAPIGGKRGGEAYGVQQGVTNSFVSSWRGAEHRGAAHRLKKRSNSACRSVEIEQSLQAQPGSDQANYAAGSRKSKRKRRR